MQTDASSPARLSTWARNSIALKLLTIGILLLLLLIPSSMVENLITQRAATRDEATEAIAAQWGGPQLLLGPVLVLPYRTTQTTTEDGKSVTTTNTQYVCVLPDTLASTGQLTPERRHRGIYEAVVYRARLHVQGAFQAPPLADLGVDPASVRWSEAFVALGLSDLKGIRNGLALRWDGQARPFEPGLPASEVLPAGSAPSVSTQVNNVVKASQRDAISSEETLSEQNAGPANGLNALVPITDATALTRRHRFAFDIDLNGSNGLLQAPLGRQTTLHLSAPWADPSFIGAFLPIQHTVTGGQFAADWRVFHLNRNYPQHWRTSEVRPNVDASTFGVRLLVPVNEYQKTMRAAKYALLPLGLTFLVFFFVEVLNRRRIHPFQYLLVGLSLVIFYVLLLALAEHLSFDVAYSLAALTIVGLVTSYVVASLRQLRPALATASVLVLVYSFVFVVLQLQDYALLVGSLGLVAVMATVMYLSRNIDWYAHDEVAQPPQAPLPPA